MSPSGIIVGNFIQVAYAVQNICHPAEQDCDEGGNRAENEGRCRCLQTAYSMARSGHDLPSEYDAYGSDRRGDEPPDILSKVDARLAEHGLEVVIYDAFDEAVSWRIEKREER